MNGHIYLSGEELEALEGLPHIVFRLYVALKKYADYATGIVGQSRRISWSLLCQELYVEQFQGFEDSGTPTRQRVARAMEWLKKKDLVQDLGSKQRGEPIVFKLVLAQTPSQVQNKPVQNPCRTRAGYPGQEENNESAADSVCCKVQAEKHVQNPCRTKRKKPSGINNQYSILLPIGNIDPVSKNNPLLGNKHSSSSTASPTAQRQSVASQCLEIFEFWQTTMNKTRAVLDNKRQTRIEWAIKHYGKDACLDAIRGCANSAWHQGENDHGKKYDDLTLIFRDASHTERFIQMAEQPSSARRKSSVQEWVDEFRIIDGEVVPQAKVSNGGLQ